MYKLITKIPSAFAVTLIIVWGFFAFQNTTHAAAGINRQVNFQGKVVNTDGTNVSNASHSFLFCIYTTASPATPCTAGANNDAIWRESKNITTVDGIFQTNLGDTTAFAALVDFNTDNIYLGINFDSNGQMTPLVRFTAAPYALNADKVHGLSVTDTTGTLTVANGKTVSFADAFTVAGAFATTLTATNTTNATLPAGTVTLAALGTAQNWTANQTFANTTGTDDTLGFSITTGGAGRFAGTLTNADLTGNHSWILPNLDGTVALTSQLHTQNTDTGTTGTSFIVGSATDSATTNTTLQFGSTNTETLVFDGASTDNFLLSDDLAINGNLTVQGTSVTGSGALTVASTTNGLTLNSGNNTLTVDSSDTALTASGVATLTLGANVSITNASGNIGLQAAGTGTANVQIGDGGAASATPDLLVLDIGSAEPTGGIGSIYYSTALNKFRCYENTGWKDCDTTGAGGGTLQTAYDASSGNTILTTTGRDVAFTLGEVATPTKVSINNQDTAGTSAEYIQNSIASGTLTNGLLFENTGAGTMTNAISILETAGTVTTGINIGNNVGTGIAIGTGVTTGISVGSGGITIAAGALAVNSDSITSDGILVINSATSTDIQDALNVDSLSTDTGGVSIAAGQSYGGAGAVTLSSGNGTALTINSGTTGGINIGDDASAETINIGTGAAVKTLVIGSLNTTSGVTIQSGSGNINLTANGTSTGNVQVGDGGAASATPDLMVLDTGSAEPAGTVGAMYYSTTLGKFRCYQGAAWADCIGSGTGGTPAGSNTQIQYNNSGAFGADAGLAFDSSTQTLSLVGTDSEINMAGITNEPSAPSAGTLNLYSKSIAGRMMPKWMGPSGLDSIVQPMVAMNKVAWWNPQGNVTTAPTAMGMSAMTVVSNGGTALTARNVATTNLFTRMKRTGIVSTATAGTLGSVRHAYAQYSIGNGSGLGGFTYVSRFGSTDTVAGARAFVGVTSATGAPTNVEPNTLTNSIGICKLSTSNNWQICYGGSAAQTAIDLGANFPANTASADMYELILYAPTNANNSVGYRVTRLGTTYQTSGTLTAATPGTQLPASTTLLAFNAWKTNNATASVVGLDIASFYIETDY